MIFDGPKCKSIRACLVRLLLFEYLLQYKINRTMGVWVKIHKKLEKGNSLEYER